MKISIHIIYKTILCITVISLFVSALSGCGFALPTGTEKAKESFNMTDNNIVPTEDADKTEKPEITPAATPIQTEKMSENALKWIERYKISGNDGDKLLMSVEDIRKFNSNTASRSDAITDIMNVPASMRGSDVRSKIESMGVVSLPKYDWDNNEIDRDTLDTILENRNLSVLDGKDINVKLGIIVQRTALRSLPTDTPFFSDPGTQYYDRIQETEVVVGNGVWVLHESENGAYCFVQTFNYTGWVATKHIAIASTYDEWKAFASPEKFAVVKASLYTTKESYTKLDMGVKLPLADVSSEGYKVKLPGRNPDGSLYYDYVTLGGDVACEDYLPFTMNNFYKQAFKYEGAIYGWGGSYDSVDCSGFVSAVMRVFGFELPRNVSQQRNVVGEVITVDGTGSANVKKVLDGISTPAAVYKPGHVMLYLGKYDGSYYVIHSPEGGRVVCEEILDTSATNLKSINKF